MMLPKGLLILAFCSVCFFPVYGEDTASQQRIVHTVSGRVIQIDWVGSKLTIEPIESLSSHRRQMVFMVPANTEIFRGTESIGLGDIEQDDDVEIGYYVNARGENEATTIVDTNLSNQ